MSFLEHLDELRSRLFRSALVYTVAVAACWAYSDRILEFLLQPIRQNLFGGGEIVFINLTEPFFVYMEASAILALFLVMPFLLYQIYAFVAPGLYPNERYLVLPFLVFGTGFFALGGAFGYYVATPTAAKWLLQLGGSFKANLTLKSAFTFESRVILGMGLVFELPVVIAFLSRVGVVTAGFLLRHFRFAVVAIVIVAAVITPTGDALTLFVFAGPMILLYLLGVAVAWVTERRRPA